MRKRCPGTPGLLLFGETHWEIDLRGCFYELVRRCLQRTDVHIVLPSIVHMRQRLVEHLGHVCPAAEAVLHAKRIIQHALNNGGDEAYRGLRRIVPLAPQAIQDLLRSVGHAASVVAAEWARMPACERDPAMLTERNAHFRVLEQLEVNVMVPFIDRLRELQAPHSLIWLHDGIWISPVPPIEALEASLSAAYQAAGLPESLHDALAVRSLAEDRAALMQRIAAPVNDQTVHQAAQLRGIKRRADMMPVVVAKRPRGLLQGEAVRSLFTYFSRTERRQ